MSIGEKQIKDMKTSISILFKLIQILEKENFKLTQETSAMNAQLDIITARLR